MSALLSVCVAVSAAYSTDDPLMSARAFKHARYHSKNERANRRERARRAAEKWRQMQQSRGRIVANHRRCIQAACARGAEQTGRRQSDKAAFRLFFRIAAKSGGDWIPFEQVVGLVDRSEAFSSDFAARAQAARRLLDVLVAGQVVLTQNGQVLPLTLATIMERRRLAENHAVKPSFSDRMPQIGNLTENSSGGQYRIHTVGRWQVRGLRGRFCRKGAQPLLAAGENEPNLGRKTGDAGFRVPTPPAVYGVRHRNLREITAKSPVKVVQPSSTSLQEAPVAYEKPTCGAKPGETATSYFSRVAAEKEALARLPAQRERRRDYERLMAEKKAEEDAQAAKLAERGARELERQRKAASQRLEAKMLEQGNVRLFIDPGKPRGPEWVYSASQRVPQLTEQTVPKELGVGALDYGLDELARAKANGRPIDNPAGFVVDLAKRVMRRERWRWAPEKDALTRPDLVVSLSPEGEPMVTAPLTLVRGSPRQER